MMRWHWLQQWSVCVGVCLTSQLLRDIQRELMCHFKTWHFHSRKLFQNVLIYTYPGVSLLFMDHTLSSLGDFLKNTVSSFLSGNYSTGFNCRCSAVSVSPPIFVMTTHTEVLCSVSVMLSPNYRSICWREVERQFVAHIIRANQRAVPVLLIWWSNYRCLFIGKVWFCCLSWLTHHEGLHSSGSTSTLL